MNKLNLKPEYIEYLREIFEKRCPSAEVWAYGSRVYGDSHAGSDLDLAIVGLEKTTITLSILKKLINDSNIPFLVDLVQFEELPNSFKTEIKNKHIVLYKCTH